MSGQVWKAGIGMVYPGSIAGGDQRIAPTDNIPQQLACASESITGGDQRIAPTLTGANAVAPLQYRLRLNFRMYSMRFRYDENAGKTIRVVV